MKINASKVFGVLALTSLLQFVPVHAVEGDAAPVVTEQKQDDQKIRFAGHAVRVHRQKIIVRTKDAKYKASTLRSDDEGLYILQSEAQKLASPTEKLARGRCPRHAHRHQEHKNKQNIKHHKRHNWHNNWKHGKRKNRQATEQVAGQPAPSIETPVAATVAP